MQTSEGDRAVDLRTLKALASAPRLSILEWLRDPVGQFPAQVDGDLIRDGVCADYIRDRLGVTAATASRHLTLLTDAGLLVSVRKKGWTFYRRNESAIRAFIASLKADL